MSACLAVPFTPWPPEKLSGILDKCELHRPWYSDQLWDDVAIRRQATIAYLVDASSNGKLWEVHRDGDIVGLLMLNELTPFVSGRAHMIFFDSKLSDKFNLCIRMMQTAFDTIPLEVIRVEVPDYAKALLKYVRKLGFRYEGESRIFKWPANAEPLSADVAKLGSRKYRSILYQGEWSDALLLSVTREEFVAHVREHYGRSFDQQNPEQHDGAAAVADRA